MTVSTSFQIDMGAVTRLTRSPTGDVARLIRRIGDEFVRQAKARAPVKSGDLKRSIKVIRVGPNLILEAGPTVDYGLAVSQGQPARSIRPNRKRVLRFPDKGGAIIFRPESPNWPGTKPNPYLYEALKAAVARYS